MKLRNEKIRLLTKKTTKKIPEMVLTTVVVLACNKLMLSDQKSVIAKPIKLPQVSNSKFVPS